MAETLPRALPCIESGLPGRFGAAAGQPGITFQGCGGLTLINLRGDPEDTAFLASARNTFGIALPLKPNTIATATHCEILWLGPDEWLLVSVHSTLIEERIAVERGFMTGVSHGRAMWRISGPRTLDLMAKGCSLDLHVRSFPAGTCAQTALAQVGMLLHRRDATTFDIYCARSYAGHLWHWLTESAAEFGYEVASPING